MIVSHNFLFVYMWATNTCKRIIKYILEVSLMACLMSINGG